MTMHSHFIPSSPTLADTEVPQFNNKTRLQLIPPGFLIEYFNPGRINNNETSCNEINKKQNIWQNLKRMGS
jgi:hypothetical protein